MMFPFAPLIGIHDSLLREETALAVGVTEIATDL
jgi:hypothetical protein